jgi:hypothetical protein
VANLLKIMAGAIARHLHHPIPVGKKNRACAGSVS